MTLKTFLKIVLGAGALLLVLFVMVNGIGLVDSLDFGAGAYYYADIPEFDRFGTPSVDFGGSALAVVAFFVVWSVIVIGLLALVKLIPKSEDD